jgi:hypothetical protein
MKLPNDSECVYPSDFEKTPDGKFIVPEGILFCLLSDLHYAIGYIEGMKECLDLQKKQAATNKGEKE